MDELRIIGLAAALNKVAPVLRRSPTVASQRIERMNDEDQAFAVFYVSALLGLLMAISACSLLMA